MLPENIRRLGEHDVVLAGYPGSGNAWLGCLFVKLGLFYLDGYHERLHDDVSQRTTILPIARRDRLLTYRDRDKLHATYREPVRIVKTHLHSNGFGDDPRFKTVVLARDGRDAVISYYNWLKSFGGLGDTLGEYLMHGTAEEQVPPSAAWAAFNEGWLDLLPRNRTYLIRFEDMRKDPVLELDGLLKFLGAPRSREELLDAIGECSFATMRNRESEAVENNPDGLGQGMIMRRGEIGEWRSVFSPEEAAFVESQCRDMLLRLGYPIAAK
ncbi:MAG: sulfotransferase domain-containing protein [Bryobacteraceae bacterium]